MGVSRRRDDYRSLASTRYLQRMASRLDSTVRDRAGLVPTLGLTLTLLALLGVWLWGRCLLWPETVIGSPGSPPVEAKGELSANLSSGSVSTNASLSADSAGSLAASGNGTTLWRACLSSQGSVFLLIYVCAVTALMVVMLAAICSVPRLKRQLEIVRRLLRADSAGCPPLPLTDVIQAVEEADMEQAERLIRGTVNIFRSYGTMVPPLVTYWRIAEA